MELKFDPATVNIRQIVSDVGGGKAPRHDPKQFKTGRVELSNISANINGFGSGDVKVARVFFDSDSTRFAAPIQAEVKQVTDTDGRGITVKSRVQIVKTP